MAQDQVDRIIQVDNREGSIQLLYSLRRGGLTAEPVRLEFGDVAFTGYGPGGFVKIGIEYKSLNDLLQSMRTGRLSGHQIPGMWREYQFCYLFVLGQWREGESGIIETPQQGGWREVRLGTTGFMWRELEGYLSTMELRCGVHVRRCRTVGDVVSGIKGLHIWFGKPWQDHGSHRVIYSPPPDQALFQKPSLVRRVAKELPDIGWERSGDIARRYTSVMDLCCASQADLEQIPGIGRIRAGRIVAALAGNESNESKS